jgi:hypothetical protein
MNKLYQHAQITINKVAIKPRISPRNNIKNFLEENDFKKTQPQYTNYYSLSASPSPPMSLSTSPSPPMSLSTSPSSNVKSSGIPWKLNLEKYPVSNNRKCGGNIISGDSSNTYASYETYLIDKLIDHQHYIEKLEKKMTTKQEKMTMIMTKLSELNKG